MAHAYSKLYLNDARRTLARSFGAAVYTFGYSLQDYFELFLKSSFSEKFGRGDPFVVSGKSGIELALETIESQTGQNMLDTEPVFSFDRSPEYWAGWALAYYQWLSGLSFMALNEAVSIVTILEMYPKYHEMDISKFCDRLDEIRKSTR
ncbi:MAG: hypothetical protein IJ691_01480 [Lachnospiraceae bacterium]|nr:hypothetical protein [Lachnospiraceae bacterium]